MTQEALKLALEALEGLKSLYGGKGHKLHEINMIHRNHDTAITALNEALAEHAMQEVQRLGQEIEQEPVAWATKEDFHRELERRLKHIREEMKIKSVTMRCKDYDIALPIIDTDFGRVLVGQVSTPPQRTEQTSAERTLQHLGYTNHGGEYWKPPLGKIRQINQEQEPVVFCMHWIDRWGCNHYADPKEPHPVNAKPLYTSPPQRTWVGLTDEEIDKESSDYDEPGYAYGFRQGALWAEDKLKENT